MMMEEKVVSLLCTFTLTKNLNISQLFLLHMNSFVHSLWLCFLFHFVVSSSGWVMRFLMSFTMSEICFVQGIVCTYYLLNIVLLFCRWIIMISMRISRFWSTRWRLMLYVFFFSRFSWLFSLWSMIIDIWQYSIVYLLMTHVRYFQ